MQRIGARAGPAQRGLVALREGPVDGADARGAGRREHAADRARAAPACCPARSTSAAPGRRASRSRCARRASPRCSGARSPRSAAARSSSRSASRSTERRCASRGAALPPRRRHARGRPDRGGRPDRRPRPAAGDAAAAPRRRRAADPRPAGAPARRGRAGRPRRCSRSRAGASPTRRCSIACAWAPTIRCAGGDDREPAVGGASIMRPTLLGSLLDAAAHNAARGGGDLALFESGTVYRAAADGPARRRAPRARRAAGRRAWRRRAGAASAARRPTSSPPRGCSARCSTRSACAWRVEPRRVALPASRARATVIAGGQRLLGLLGELHPLVAAAWDLGPAGGLGDRPRARRRARARAVALRAVRRPSRPCARTSPSSWPTVSRPAT